MKNLRPGIGRIIIAVEEWISDGIVHGQVVAVGPSHTNVVMPNVGTTVVVSGAEYAVEFEVPSPVPPPFIVGAPYLLIHAVHVLGEVVR